MIELFNIFLYKTININGWFRGFKSLHSTIKNKNNDLIITFNNQDRIILHEANDKISMFINNILVYNSDTIDFDWIVELYKDYLINKGWKNIEITYDN